MLTTHELPEAERLADEVVIIAKGRAVASGTVAALAASGAPSGIRFEAPFALDTAALAAALGAAHGDVTEEPPGTYRVAGEATATRVAAVAGWLADRNLPLGDLRTGRRSLEEVYLEVTKPNEAQGEGRRGAPDRGDDTPVREGPT
jgi:ABC-2 type transport system ATP-binding protein